MWSNQCVFAKIKFYQDSATITYILLFLKKKFDKENMCFICKTLQLTIYVALRNRTMKEAAASWSVFSYPSTDSAWKAKAAQCLFIFLHLRLCSIFLSLAHKATHCHLQHLIILLCWEDCRAGMYILTLCLTLYWVLKWSLVRSLKMEWI